MPAADRQPCRAFLSRESVTGKAFRKGDTGKATREWADGTERAVGYVDDDVRGPAGATRSAHGRLRRRHRREPACDALVHPRTRGYSSRPERFRAVRRVIRIEDHSRGRGRPQLLNRGSRTRHDPIGHGFFHVFSVTWPQNPFVYVLKNSLTHRQRCSVTLQGDLCRSFRHREVSPPRRPGRNLGCVSLFSSSMYRWLVCSNARRVALTAALVFSSALVADAIFG